MHIREKFMSNRFHVIKDPVHGTMQFTSVEDSWMKPFVDSPDFQRLRHIKQLGMGDYIFPGAVHTRFNHCLGCCYVGSQIAKKIGLKDQERQLVLIACLLHDIGHGPFSHAFEGVFKDKLIRHEAWTPYFLADYETDTFFYEYNQLNSKYPLTAEKFKEIANMIMHKPVKRRVLADIVSSQLDADRFDYLLRDSHFCGIEYGQFDLKWMLHCMTIVATESGDRLGITHKGVGVTEHYLMARRLLTRNICHIRKKLAIEEFLVQMLSSLASSIEDEPILKDTQSSKLGKFLIAANRFNKAVTMDNKEQLIEQFLKDNFANYRELCDYDVYRLMRQLANINSDHAAVQIAKRIQHRIMPVTIRVAQTHVANAIEALNEFKKQHAKQYQDWQIRFIQSPHQSYSGEDDPIFVINEHGQVNPLSDYSIMIDAISDRLEHVAFISFDQIISEDKPVLDFMEEIKGLTETVAV